MKKLAMLLALAALSFTASSYVVRPGTMYAAPSQDLQAAVDSTPAGGVLQLGVGTFTVPSGGLVINKSMELCGSVHGTFLAPHSIGDGQPAIVVRSGYVSIHDLHLYGQRTGTAVRHAGSYGIVVATTATSGTYQDIRISRVYVGLFGDDGIHAEGYDAGSNAIIGLKLDDVGVGACKGQGVYIRNATLCSCRDSYFDQNDLAGLYTPPGPSWVGLSLSNVGFENNNHSASADPYHGAQCVLNNVHPGYILGCHFEHFNNPADQPSCRQGLYVNLCDGLVVAGCLFLNGAFSTGTVGIRVSNDSVQQQMTILPNSFNHVDDPVVVGPKAVGVSV